MLQATYKDNTYTFYVTTEDVRIDTSVPAANLWYLFKFTNDMSGAIKWAYGQNQVVANRYTKVEFYPSSKIAPIVSEDPLLGVIDFSPNGYWSYEVYECSSTSVISPLTSCNAPLSPTSTFGSFTISDFSGAVLVSNTFTDTTPSLYNQFVEGLDGHDGITYENNPIVQQDPCGVSLGTQGIFIQQQNLQEGDLPFTEIQNCVQTSIGITFDVVSNMPVGYSYAFRQDDGVSADFQITDITTNPQTTSHSLAQFTPYSQNLIEMTCYTLTGGSAGGGGDTFNKVHNIYPHKTPTDRFGMVKKLISNHEQMKGPSVITKGSSWYMASNGDTLNSETFGLLGVNGVVEVGKLLISEQEGEQQVQYTQHSTTEGTNYIYNE